MTPHAPKATPVQIHSSTRKIKKIAVDLVHAICGVPNTSALRAVEQLDTYADCMRALEVENARLGRSSVIEAIRRRATQIRRRDTIKCPALTGREVLKAVAVLAVLSLTFFLGCLL